MRKYDYILRLRRGPQSMSWTKAYKLSSSLEVALKVKGSHPALLARSGGCGACAAPFVAPQEGALSVASEGNEPMSSAIFDRSCAPGPTPSTLSTPAAIPQP